jgi:hypothetical protein
MIRYVLEAKSATLIESCKNVATVCPAVPLAFAVLLAIDRIGQSAVTMKHSWFLFVFLLLSTVSLTGCEVIADIFKAGVWVGAVLVILVIGLVVWLVTRSKA